MFKEIAIKDSDFQPAPQWMVDYLDKLKKATFCQKPIEIRVLDPELLEGKTIGVTANADGFLRSVSDPDKPSLIIVRSDTPDEEKGRSLIRHEFIHHLHDEIDRIFASQVGGFETPEYAAYMQAVEKFVQPMMMMLGVASYMGYVYELRDDDDDMDDDGIGF